MQLVSQMYSQLTLGPSLTHNLPKIAKSLTLSRFV